MVETAPAARIREPARDRLTGVGILLEASEAAATHSLDFDALMESLASLVRKIVDYELYVVMVPNSAGDLRVAHSVGFAEDVVRSLRIPVGSGLTGRAAATRQSVLVEDVRKDPDYVCMLDSVRSEVAVPLVARGQVVAVLDLQSNDHGAFDRSVSDLLELVCSRFSLAIDVATLYHMQKKQHSTLRTLRKIAHEFSHILQLGELLQKISTLVRTLIRYDVLAIYLKDPDRPLLRHYFGVKFKERQRWRNIEMDEGLVGAAARSRQPVLVREPSRDPRYIASLPGIRSEVAIPLVLKNELVGVLDLQSFDPETFSDDEARTLSLLAPQIATAIENARLYEEKAVSEARLERDLAAARALQQHMLPNGRREALGLEIVARNLPASVVSGDFYNFFDRGHRIDILNGDVSGKGAAAALYAALASGVIRSAVRTDLSPGTALNLINSALVELGIDARYLAALLASWNGGERRLTMASAGMPPPYVARDGRLDRIRLAGVPLGLLGGSEYDEVDFELAPGDFAVTVSDGFTESVDHNGEPWGDDRLMDILSDHRADSAETILDRIFEDVASFSDGCPLFDDRTAVVLRVVDRNDPTS